MNRYSDVYGNTAPARKEVGLDLKTIGGTKIFDLRLGAFSFLFMMVSEAIKA
jgi:hypothetical protein